MVQVRLTDWGHKILLELQKQEIVKRKAGDRISLSLVLEKTLEEKMIQLGLPLPEKK